MTLSGKKVWVRDPALADEAVFVKGTVISEDATQARTQPSNSRLHSLRCPGLCAGRAHRASAARVAWTL